MTEFDDQLKKAIQRGLRSHDSRQQQAKEQQMSADDIRRQHNEFRLGISERIEQTLQSLIHQLPGFEYENIYGERGWGGAVSRDELNIRRGERVNVYSRLEVTVKPLSDLNIVNLVAKGTIKNREIFARKDHKPIAEADLDEFLEQVDRWVLEYAQLYSAADAP
ncbi:MAG: hypothetical protein ACR2NP_17665 [Pirellulaceae bacterium]